jgi:hypothetical protein
MKQHTGLVLIAMLGTSTSSSQSVDLTLRRLDAADYQTMICGCTFRESAHGSDGGGYGSGPDVLVIAPNAEPPHALINLGYGNVRLLPARPIEFPMYQCSAGRKFRTEWRAEGIAVSANLAARRAGEESCWFSGSITVSSKSATSHTSVEGACGC